MTDKDFQIIDAYLQGDLSEEDRQGVEERAVSSAAFGEALRERRRFAAHLAAKSHEEALRPTLSVLGEQFFPDQQGAVVRPLRPWWRRPAVYGSAAAILLVFALALSFLFPSGNTYAEFAQHDPLSITERGTALADAAAAETAFNAGDYLRAIPLLERYLADQAEDERARLALGIAYLESNEDEKAVNIFTEIAASEGALAAYGNWYLALAAVKRGDSAAALIFLDKIPSTDTYLTEKANRLRASL
ncbi:tetratricopeptide repeat protein [Lewinella sp. W8]|uniref:tetratricopeptide repeat protein n=1 Tax=Lewinella sp. W8 TaxID=2528208 RepID=UPI00106737C7|nr:tetratricopeptide repeat protein [Lewinella sp. W8]MTB50152.1 tetratricopeptide repeat protein [Lewinella sp. W8]